jgi:hypothetical protein
MNLSSWAEDLVFLHRSTKKGAPPYAGHRVERLNHTTHYSETQKNSRGNTDKSGQMIMFNQQWNR